MDNKENNSHIVSYPILPLGLFVLMLISLGGFLYFKAIDTDIERLFKIFTSILFILIAIVSYKFCPKNKIFFILILIGLIFSLAGDIFLSFSDSNFIFILGVGSFSIAHIAYSIGFCLLTKISWEDLLLTLIIAVPTICLEIFKDGFVFGGMFPLIVLYTILISFMVAKAFSLLKLKKENLLPISLVILGAVLFFISDFILLFLFYYINKTPILAYLNATFYYLGQGLLALSFIKGIEIKFDK